VFLVKSVQETIWVQEPGGPALFGSRCGDCGLKAFPARRVCAKCFSENQSAVVLSRYGSIYSFTRVFIKTPLFGEVPYAVGYVLLADGLTVPARLRCSGEFLKIGSPVVMEIETNSEKQENAGNDGYYFRPETGVQE